MQANRTNGYNQNLKMKVTTAAPAKTMTATQNRPPRRRSRLRLWLIILLLLLLILLLAPFVIVQLINSTNENRMYDNVEQIPARPVAIVFGAGLQRNGNPSPILADRLNGAISLYKAGKVQRLLLTGDNVTSIEVNSMRSYAIRQGVPASALLSDNAGLRTYDSCYRASHTFGITSAILVTQAYHLPRALYLCNALGLEAVGLKAGLNSEYPGQTYNNSREFAATFVSWLDITIFRPKPEQEK